MSAFQRSGFVTFPVRSWLVVCSVSGELGFRNQEWVRFDHKHFAHAYALFQEPSK